MTKTVMERAEAQQWAERVQRLEAEVERLRLIERNMLIENERVRERIHTMIAERDVERKIYNDAIAGHLAEVSLLKQALVDAKRFIFDSALENKQ
jgi:hypothetical protein